MGILGTMACICAALILLNIALSSGGKKSNHRFHNFDAELTPQQEVAREIGKNINVEVHVSQFL